MNINLLTGANIAAMFCSVLLLGCHQLQTRQVPEAAGRKSGVTEAVTFGEMRIIGIETQSTSNGGRYAGNSDTFIVDDGDATFVLETAVGRIDFSLIAVPTMQITDVPKRREHFRIIDGAIHLRDQ